MDWSRPIIHFVVGFGRRFASRPVKRLVTGGHRDRIGVNEETTWDPIRLLWPALNSLVGLARRITRVRDGGKTGKKDRRRGGLIEWREGMG
jgi:hypothetical protein